MAQTRPPQPLLGSAQLVLGAFVAGIVAGKLFGPDPPVAGVVSVVMLAGAAVMARFNRTGSVLVLAGVCVAGMAALSVQQSAYRRFVPPDEMVNRLVSIGGVIDDTPRVEGVLSSFILTCDSLYYRGDRIETRGFVAVTARTDSVTLFEGDRVVVRGTLRAFPEPVAGWWPRLNGYRYTPYRLMSQGGESGLIVAKSGQGMFEHLRAALADRMARFRFGGYGGLFAAMTIADTSRLDRDLRDRFADAGMAHLLAVSGLHAGIIAVILGALLSLFGAGRQTRAVLVILGVACYAGLCGFRPPVVRAAIMCGMVMTGRIIERRLDGEHTLAIAGLAILSCDPSALFGLSFQLSFVAVWTIVTFFHTLHEYLARRMPTAIGRNKMLTTPLSLGLVSFLAVMGTAPIVAVSFGKLPLVSVPVNMLAVPIAFVILTAGGSAVALSFAGPVGMAPAMVCDAIAGWFLQALVWIGGYVSSLPFATLDTGMVTPFLALSMLAWLFCAARAAGRPVVKRMLIYLPLSVLVVSVWLPIVQPAAGVTEARTVFFDVGQGDAALFGTGTRLTLLVDTGPPGAGRTVVESLDALGVRRIDGVILSHFDSDHAGGLAAIIDTMPIGRVFCRQDSADSLGAVLPCPVIGLAAGDSVSFPGGGMMVFFPTLEGNNASGENDRSLVVRCDAGGLRVLFAGDIGDSIQRRLAAWGDALKSTVVKVPHHGSRPAVTALYEAAKPSLAVISCGLNNTYGHPTPQTVAMLDSLGMEVFDTGRDGHVQITGGYPGVSAVVLSR